MTAFRTLSLLSAAAMLALSACASSPDYEGEEIVELADEWKDGQKRVEEGRKDLKSAEKDETKARKRLKAAEGELKDARRDLEKAREAQAADRLLIDANAGVSPDPERSEAIARAVRKAQGAVDEAQDDVRKARRDIDRAKDRQRRAEDRIARGEREMREATKSYRGG